MNGKKRCQVGPLRVLLFFLAASAAAVPLFGVCDESEMLLEEDAKLEKQSDKNDGDSPYTQMEMLTEVMLHIRKHYVDDKTYEDITRGALDGMLHALDRHSGYLKPEAYNNMQEETSGKFSGIGIQIAIRDNVLTIVAPIEDTPGFKAGLQSGDQIVEIEGESTAGITLPEAVTRLRGPRGEKVVLTVRSASDKSTRRVEVIRDEIRVPSVKGARVVKDGIGYVRVVQFTSRTADSLQNAIEELADEGMDALILDLRSNPGGLLSSAVRVAQKFLEKGQLIVTTKGRTGVRKEAKARAMGDYHNVDMLMAVLVNGGTASASEIVAGALQDHQRAVLVGSTTFGKGSVQSVIQLKAEGNSAIRLTTARYYTPSGRQIHEKGIEPDISVVVPVEEWRKVQIKRLHDENPVHYTEEEKAKCQDAVDRQFARAFDLLQAIRIFEKRSS